MAQPIAIPRAKELKIETTIAGEVAPRAFIAEQTVGSLLRNALVLYRSNFRPLFLTYFLPTYPVLVLQNLALGTKNVGMLVVASIAGWLVTFLATSALTVTISDICLGTEPTVRRAYAKLLKGGLWLRVLWTSLVQFVAIVAGFALLIVPGVILTIRLSLCSTVVVLERLAGTQALRRSMDLTKGHYWRLFGVFVLLSMLLVSALFAGLLPVTLVIGMLVELEAATWFDVVIQLLVDALLQGIMYPMLFIAIVLLYYDLRARKEAYDVETLSEDMMR